LSRARTAWLVKKRAGRVKSDRLSCPHHGPVGQETSTRRRAAAGTTGFLVAGVTIIVGESFPTGEPEAFRQGFERMSPDGAALNSDGHPALGWAISESVGGPTGRSASGSDQHVRFLSARERVCVSALTSPTTKPVADRSGGTTEPAAPPLSDRVRSLRLPAKPRAAPSPLPWVTTALFAALSVYLALGGKIGGLPQPLASTSADGDQAAESSKAGTVGTSATAGASGKSASATSSSIAGSEPSGSASTNKTDSATGSAAAPPQIVLEASGWIIPEQQILVSPQVSGRVVELNFEAGQRVEKGFVLAVLDRTEYVAEYERTAADVAAAQERVMEAEEGSRPDEIRQATAELEEARTQLDQAKRTLDRKKELFTQKIVTDQDLDDAESSYRGQLKRVEALDARAQLLIDGPRSQRKRIAVAELKRASAELARSQWRLDNTTIYAPITGTILKKNAELGNLVNPVAFNGSFSLCDMADLSRLEVELAIQERDISKVFRGQKCQVRTDAFPTRMYTGYVSRLMPIADRAKSAVPVRVRLSVPSDEEGMYLRPEMGARVTFFDQLASEAAATATPPTTATRPATASSSAAGGVPSAEIAAPAAVGSDAALPNPTGSAAAERDR
jgi:HlyD family secretion protein